MKRYWIVFVVSATKTNDNGLFNVYNHVGVTSNDGEMFTAKEVCKKYEVSLDVHKSCILSTAITSYKEVDFDEFTKYLAEVKQ